MSRKRIPIDEKVLQTVKQLAGFGLRDDQICLVVNMSETTLKGRCRDALDLGRAEGAGHLARTMFQMATSGKHVAATIFCCKVRLGWKETAAFEVGGIPGGEPVAIEDVRERLLAKLAKMNAGPAVPP